MLFKYAKRTQSSIDWNEWKQQRNLVTSLNRRLHSEYIESEISKLTYDKPNMHKYYQILSKLTGRKQAQSIPPLVKPDGETVHGDLKNPSSSMTFLLHKPVLTLRLCRYLTRNILGLYPL